MPASGGLAITSLWCSLRVMTIGWSARFVTAFSIMCVGMTLAAVFPLYRYIKLIHRQKIPEIPLHCRSFFIIIGKIESNSTFTSLSTLHSPL